MILAICNNKVCKLYNGYDSFHCWFYMFPECIIRHYFGTRTDDLTQVNFVGQNQCICFLLINKTNRELDHWLSSSLYCYAIPLCTRTDNEWSCIIYLHSYELEEAVSCIYTGKKPRNFVSKNPLDMLQISWKPSFAAGILALIVTFWQHQKTLLSNLGGGGAFGSALFKQSREDIFKYDNC